MKLTKKLLALLLAAVMLLPLFGCEAVSSVVEDKELVEDIIDIVSELTGDGESTEGSGEAAKPAAAQEDKPAQEPQAETPAPQEAPKEEVPAQQEAPKDEAPAHPAEPEKEQEPALLDKNGWYYSKDEVALYIHQYGCLPGNFITKKDAEKLGWPGGSLEPYAPGKAIGGSHFGNYEGILPEKKGRSYTECDIDTKGAKSRGAKRIVFSNDGLIYYTEDHYETFELLYGEE